ncbi:MAG: thiamine pyrophosphate-dependent enzyme [Planctomycetaceae bacterium]
MSVSRVEIVEGRLDAFLKDASPAARALAPDEPLRPGGGLDARKALELFEDQAASRALDVASRELRKTSRTFYTISSAGHEQNAVVGALLRIDDPCFLHYRSGGLMMARARRLAGSTPVFDTMLSFCASREEPIAGGRHKVWGSKPLWVPPQTSTIASHLPKAVGMAVAIGRARRLGVESGLPADAIVCCSFGDASLNHATALAGINAARYAHRRGAPVPILFLCEDNGIGISVDTPRDWVRESVRGLPHLRYFEAAGDLDGIFDVAAEAVAACRENRAPVFLHLHCTRLWGHAGTDVEATYRTMEEIAAAEEADPLLGNARRLVETGAATPTMLAEIVRTTRARVNAAAEEAATRPRLATAAEVVAPLAPWDEERVREAAERTLDSAARLKTFAGTLPERATAPTKRTLAAHVNSALTDAMLRFPEMLVFGEDVGRKGGVYYVTAGLQKRFGIARCFDTLLDETTILGLAQGFAHAGLLPVPEIQYLAYLHNALDQLRGEACSLQYFSNGQFENPMVVRVQGLAYQKGFGGHFHNDNSVGALRDIPGLMLAAPSRGDDAARLLRGALAAARACGRVVVFLEPIALYHEKDLYEEGDGLWLSDYPAPGAALLPGEVGVHHPDASDLLLVSYANGLRLSLRAARALARDHGARARVLDLRWLNPLPREALLAHAQACGRVLVADECRATGGGVADAVLAALVEAGFPGPLRSVRSIDTYIPLGPAADTVLLSEAQILEAAKALLR